MSDRDLKTFLQFRIHFKNLLGSSSELGLYLPARKKKGQITEETECYHVIYVGRMENTISEENMKWNGTQNESIKRNRNTCTESSIIWTHVKN